MRFSRVNHFRGAQSRTFGFRETPLFRIYLEGENEAGYGVQAPPVIEKNRPDQGEVDLGGGDEPVLSPDDTNTSLRGRDDVSVRLSPNRDDPISNGISESPPSRQPQSPPATTQQRPIPGIRGAFANHFENVDQFESDDDFIEELVDLASRGARMETDQYRQVEELARYGEAVLPYWNEITEFLNSRTQQPGQRTDQQTQPTGQPQQAETQPATTPQTPPKWSPPPFDDGWESRVRWDGELGRYLPVTAADHDAAAGMNRFLQWSREHNRRLILDPIGVWQDAGGLDVVQGRVQELIKPVMDELQQLRAWRDEQQKREAEATIQQLYEQWKDVVYVLDEHGNPQLSGDQYAMTPIGRVAVHTKNRLLQQGAPLAEAQRAMVEILQTFKATTQPGTEGVQGTGTNPRSARVRLQPRGDRGRFAPMSPEEKDRLAREQFVSSNRPTNGAGHSPPRRSASPPESEESDDWTPPRSGEPNFLELADEEYFRKTGNRLI